MIFQSCTVFYGHLIPWPILKHSVLDNHYILPDRIRLTRSGFHQHWEMNPRPWVGDKPAISDFTGNQSFNRYTSKWPLSADYTRCQKAEPDVHPQQLIHLWQPVDLHRDRWYHSIIISSGCPLGTAILSKTLLFYPHMSNVHVGSIYQVWCHRKRCIRFIWIYPGNIYGRQFADPDTWWNVDLSALAGQSAE